MVFPNFLIIGAAKSGTTSIAQYLKQHPKIYISPIKEPYFFSFEGNIPNFKGSNDSETFAHLVTNLDDYENLFKEVSDEIAIGEASVSYLHIPSTAQNIFHHLPQVKILVVLRNPVDRAYAHFLHQIRDGHESQTDFAKALEAEEKRIQDDWMFSWFYKNNGFYFKQLSFYTKLFDPSQIKVWLYEDLQQDAIGLLQDMFRFLEVDETFTPDLSVRYNISGIPKNKAIFKFIDHPSPIKKLIRPLFPPVLRQKIRTQALQKPSLSNEIRQELIGVYRDDILQLQDLINRDLSSWLQ